MFYNIVYPYFLESSFYLCYFIINFRDILEANNKYLCI